VDTDKSLTVHISTVQFGLQLWLIKRNTEPLLRASMYESFFSYRADERPCIALYREERRRKLVHTHKERKKDEY
jgi:hypothetical protein